MTRRVLNHLLTLVKLFQERRRSLVAADEFCAGHRQQSGPMSGWFGLLAHNGAGRVQTGQTRAAPCNIPSLGPRIQLMRQRSQKDTHAAFRNPHEANLLLSVITYATDRDMDRPMEIVSIGAQLSRSLLPTAFETRLNCLGRPPA